MVRWNNLPGAKVDRFRNIQKHTVDGHTFDSKAEMQRYLELKLLVRAGQIDNLRLQPRFPITIGGVEVRMKSKKYHKTGRHVTYVADFDYNDLENDCYVIEDVKMKSGYRTEVYKLKKAMAEAMGLVITEV